MQFNSIDKINDLSCVYTLTHTCAAGTHTIVIDWPESNVTLSFVHRVIFGPSNGLIMKTMKLSHISISCDSIFFFFFFFSLLLNRFDFDDHGRSSLWFTFRFISDGIDWLIDQIGDYQTITTTTVTIKMYANVAT